MNAVRDCRACRWCERPGAGKGLIEDRCRHPAFEVGLASDSYMPAARMRKTAYCGLEARFFEPKRHVRLIEALARSARAVCRRARSALEREVTRPQGGDVVWLASRREEEKR